MSKLLRGNYDAPKTIESEKSTDGETEKFEREALRRLGGSIAYVSKRKFVWSGDSSPVIQEKRHPVTTRPAGGSWGVDNVSTKTEKTDEK